MWSLLVSVCHTVYFFRMFLVVLKKRMECLLELVLIVNLIT